jgi:hypothetical protein
MLSYRAYLLDRHGHIFNRIDLSADDDDAANGIAVGRLRCSCHRAATKRPLNSSRTAFGFRRKPCMLDMFLSAFGPVLELPLGHFHCSLGIGVLQGCAYDAVPAASRFCT